MVEPHTKILFRNDRQPSADWFDILFDASNRLTELTDIQILVRFDHLLTGIFRI